MSDYVWLIPAAVLTVGLVGLVVRARRKQREKDTYL